MFKENIGLRNKEKALELAGNYVGSRQYSIRPFWVGM